MNVMYENSQISEPPTEIVEIAAGILKQNRIREYLFRKCKKIALVKPLFK